MSLTYAIGDIHGCRAELVRLLDAIAAHAGGSSYSVVCLGDYVDKGTDSAGVLDLLMRWGERSSTPLICIKGNHDELMAGAATGTEAEAKWWAMGGQAVLAQYGVRHASELPSDLLIWLRALPLSHDDGLRYFVHAGVDPARPLADQTADVQTSMRGVFLTRDFDFGRYIVHGHTPRLDGEPELRPFRCDLDTNVTLTGRLTAAMFDARAGGPAAILATTPDGGVVVRDLQRTLELS